MADIRERIPGWLDAVKVERENHESAFAYPFDMIAGFPVRHMSLLDMSQLLAMGCPFVFSLPTEDEFIVYEEVRNEAALVVAFLHTGFRSRPGRLNAWRNRRIQRAVLKVRPAFLHAELRAYQERTLMDKIGSSGKPEAISSWASVVGYIDLVASEYGWSKDAIMQMPFRQLIQFCRRILKRLNDKLPMPSISDTAIAEYTRKLNQKTNEQL